MAIIWRVKELREARGMTRAQLAERSGLAYNTVLALERGAPERVELGTLEALCRALEAEPGELFALEPAVKARRRG